MKFGAILFVLQHISDDSQASWWNQDRPTMELDAIVWNMTMKFGAKFGDSQASCRTQDWPTMEFDGLKHERIMKFGVKKTLYLFAYCIQQNDICDPLATCRNGAGQTNNGFRCYDETW